MAVVNDKLLNQRNGPATPLQNAINIIHLKCLRSIARILRTTGNTPNENKTKKPVRISLTKSNDIAESDERSCFASDANVEPASVLTPKAMPPIALLV